MDQPLTDRKGSERSPSFFHSAFTADYELSGKKFKLFVIEGADPKECRNMIHEYLKHTGNLQIKIEEGRFQLKDPYHGGMDFYWKGRYIWGALDLADEALRSRVLKFFAEGLEKKPVYPMKTGTNR